MRNVAAAANFREKGGSEPALMSTTSDLSVAVQYMTLGLTQCRPVHSPLPCISADTLLFSLM